MVNMTKHDLIDDLIPEFGALVRQLLDGCLAAGVEMRPFFGVRSAQKQAELWRQSRTTAQINAAVDMLRAAGAHWIAHRLIDAGPQYGRWATNALPGKSWHQYGEAVDCVWIRNGEQCWDTSVLGAQNGYHIYALIADDLGLTNLGASIGDWAHVQYQPYPAPDYDWLTINKMMIERFAIPKER